MKKVFHFRKESVALHLGSLSTLDIWRNGWIDESIFSDNSWQTTHIEFEFRISVKVWQKWQNQPLHICAHTYTNKSMHQINIQMY